MKKKHTDGAWIVSPINSNLIISEETQECLAIVMSGKYNGLAFPESRQEKQANAKVIAMASEMLNFLETFSEMLPKNSNSVYGDTHNVSYDNEFSIGQKIEDLINKAK